MTLDSKEHGLSQVGLLGRFIGVREPNLKYLGLENMVRLAEVPAVMETVSKCAAVLTICDGRCRRRVLLPIVASFEWRQVSLSIACALCNHHDQGAWPNGCFKRTNGTTNASRLHSNVTISPSVVLTPETFLNLVLTLASDPVVDRQAPEGDRERAEGGRHQHPPPRAGPHVHHVQRRQRGGGAFRNREVVLQRILRLRSHGFKRSAAVLCRLLLANCDGCNHIAGLAPFGHLPVNVLRVVDSPCSQTQDLLLARPVRLAMLST